VHILRAPNSHSDKLEVNTNLLDDRRDVNVVEVREEDYSGMGLGSGTALENQVNKPREVGGGFGMSPADHSSSGSRTSWMEDDDFLESMDRSKSLLNPGTLATSSSSTPFPGGSCFSIEEDDLSLAYDDVSTLPDTESSGAPPKSLKLEYSLRSTSSRLQSADSNSISGWGTSSLQSHSMVDGISLPSMPYDERSHVSKNSVLPPSAVMKDQLKYYMKRHLSPRSAVTLLETNSTSSSRD